MSATFSQEFTAAQDQTFQQRCQVAAVAFAINTVQNEDPATVNHVRRATLGNKVALNPSAYAYQFALGTIALNQVSDGSTLNDTTVENSVATIWNIVAGTV